MGWKERTKLGNQAAVPGKHGPGTNVGLGQRVLDGSEQQTAAAHHETLVQAAVDGIFRLVVVVVPVRRHFAGRWWRETLGWVGLVVMDSEQQSSNRSQLTIWNGVGCKLGSCAGNAELQERQPIEGL